MAQKIDLEFQPNLQHILVQNVKETTTVDEALDKFSKQAGIVKTSIKRAIPYRPVFSNLSSGALPCHRDIGSNSQADAFFP